MLRPPTEAIRAYPNSRKGRSGGIQPEALQGMVAPRTRFFTAAIQNGAGAVTWYVFPRCIGPGIIRELQLFNHLGSDPVQATIEVGVTYSPLATGFQAFGLPRPYEVLTEIHRDSNRVLGQVGSGIPLSTIPQGTNRPPHTLDLIVTQPEFYPVIGIVNDSGLNATNTLHLRVLEQVNPEALRFFH